MTTEDNNGNVTLRNDPNLSLARFLGEPATAAARLEPRHPGWIRLADGVQVLAYSSQGTIHAGRKVIIIGVDGTRLIARPAATSEPALLQRISVIISDLHRTLEKKHHDLSGDGFLARGDPEAAIEEFEKAEELSLDPETFVSKMESRARSAIARGDMQEAFHYYHKFLFLRKKISGLIGPENED